MTESDYPDTDPAWRNAAAIFAVLLIVILLAAAAYWMMHGRDRLWPRPSDPPLDAALGCSLSQAECRLQTARNAMGGDLTATLRLVDYYTGNAPGGADTRDLTEAYVWAGIGKCSVTVGELDFEHRFQRDRAATYLDAITPQLSSSQLDAARHRLTDQLKGLGVSGYIIVGDMHMAGCALERDLVRAGAYFIAAAEFDGFGSDIAEARWQELYPRLSSREAALARQYAQQLSISRRGGSLPILEAALRADEIDVDDLQIALIDLGHLRGAVDGKIGPQTRAAVRSFQECEGLAGNGELSPDLRVRIIQTAAHGSLADDDFLPRGAASCHLSRGSPHSSLVLGMMYMSGVGVAPDLNRAENYLRAAARQAGPEVDRRFKVSGRANLGLALLTYKYKLPEAATEPQQQALLAETCEYFKRADSYPGEPLAHLREDIARLRTALDPYMSSGDCRGPIRR